ncbi:tRNA (adenosine(37)-N6)-dimethylallyltransferase MiaA [Anaeropeptidivorans aminofermentans]|uniref:tRNA (adenosine(37)-N6)-dimethylallyltransferase MiaA n=1 Tax=Anaeropeptidivorans aminofermentans TaxID=2934315 RepID=UPI0020245693|nr:tRNA (adenosine(37)-N6)-dimethylallyltransferase MiaA [Anaeropeptidivorans aminofermentans]
MNSEEKKSVLIIAGPTASGKSALAIELAKKINGEIISADSMQVYKYMNIGTAKASEKELSEIKHHLIDVLYPDEPFSVAIFKEMAENAIKDISERGKIPIIAGGTGFYINALLYGTDFSSAEKEADDSYRNHLLTLAEEKGKEYIHTMLFKVDPEAAEKIHFNNIKRVIRALEFYHETGTKISEHNKNEKSRDKAYHDFMFVLHMNRDILYDRINKRVDQMIEEGLVKEVHGLLHMGYDRSLISMQGLGYKEIIRYIDGECTLEEAVDTLKQSTRHFAKRQITWFKHQNEAIWLDVLKHEDINELTNEVINIIKQDGIIK